MKKLRTVFITVLILSVFALPFQVSAKTIKEFEAEVEKFTKDLEEKESKVAKNEQEVAQIKANINKIEGEIRELEQQTAALEKEIEESNQEIEKKSKESKQLFEYLQVSEGNNTYLEYIFGAESVTDMIYRMSIVEQLTEYNKQVMEELQALIDKNQAKKQELSTKKAELKKKTSELESEKERINADTKSIKEAMPSVKQQLKEAKANLEYYKKLGCGSDEDIYQCQYRYDKAHSGSSGGGPLVPSADGFYRPMVSGYVTQNWGGYGGHLGMDLSNTNKTMDIYPIADGVVFKKFLDSAGALVLKIRHNVGGRYIYSTYAHLSNWYVNENQVVTSNTKIGSMGNTGNSFGAHLHLEITTCDWNRGGGCTWAQYQRSTINPRQYISFPTTLRAWWQDR